MQQKLFHQNEMRWAVICRFLFDFMLHPIETGWENPVVSFVSKPVSKLTEHA
jgi:hypothetical protein